MQRTKGAARVAIVSVLFLVLSMVSVSAAHTIRIPAASSSSSGINFSGGTYADTTFEDVVYVSVDFLGELFAAKPRWEPAAQQMRLRDTRGRDWVFTLDNPFVAVTTPGGKADTYNLTYPVRRGPERVYLPLHPVLRLLRSRFGIDLPLVPSEGAAGAAAGKSMPSGSGSIKVPITAPLPRAGGSRTTPGRITGVTLEETPDGTVLRIETPIRGPDGEPAAQFQGVLTRPHFLVRAFGGTLAPDLPRRLEGEGGVQSVELRQQGKTAQFTIRLRGSRDSVELAQDSAGWRVTVRRPSAEPTTARGTIIVDAGHGGTDPGAMMKGAQEAAINLAVAKELRRELQERGYRVLLTREDDTFKTLPERPKFASDSAGDLFISLHCNSLAGTASRLQGVTGHVAYILREAESEEDKAIARRENKAIEEQNGKAKKTEISPLDWILLEHQLNLYSKQSESLAESIIKNFAGFDIPKYTTGARQAGFFVLVGAYMPAVLFEMGFITHDHDREVLSSRDGQREIAQRLGVAIDAFQKQRNNGQ